MSGCAFLFPGQGSQQVGMAADLIDRSPEVAALFRAGSDLVGRDLGRLVRDGPEEELSRTDMSQVAIFLHSMAVLTLLERRLGGPPPAAAAAGLSLGEYSALVFAGSIEPEEALRVVALRGRFMQEAAEAVPGAMVSILGPELPHVEALVNEARGDDVLAVANWNSPTQVVVSGAVAAVERLEGLARSRGIRKTVRLKVAGAFHSPLMAPAAEKLGRELAPLTIREPRVPFIPNRAGQVVTDPEAIRRCLVEQVTGSVMWTPTVRTLGASGVTRAVEAGPGSVLAGLARRTLPELPVTSIGTYAEVERWQPCEERAVS
jgi:[acyl-carrier-protein] S-malonyltransferase